MTRSLFLALAMLSFCVYAWAQPATGSVRGKLLMQDSLGSQPLTGATVSVIRIADSSLITYVTTNKEGSFEIKTLAQGAYTIKISYMGLRTVSRRFEVKQESPVVDLGAITLGRDYKLLDAVVITDDAPVKVKQDTTEFKADAFKSNKPNAVVEDLLKKLPGVEVDKDGNVKSQGEQIQKVYVDGKEFFGTDPKLATKNLSQDMVESIQVYDDMSEQAKFTKIDDGSRQKAINIKLKKNKKHGTFGKVSAGAGTDSRYDASLNINRFNGDRQLAFIGGANNVNKQAFSFSDVIGGMGGFNGGGRSFGGGMRLGASQQSAGNTGIISPLSGGFNYHDSWGPKIDVTGSLFYSRTNTVVTQEDLQQNFFPGYDSTSTDNTRSTSNSTNQNVRFNLRMEYKIDSMNSLLYYPSLTFQHSDGHSMDSSAITAQSNRVAPYLAITSANRNDNNRDGSTMNQNLLFRHRFAKAGRTITVGVTSLLNYSNGSGQSYSPYRYYLPTGVPYQEHLLDQNTTQLVNGHNSTISTSYTEPIGKNKILELNYAYTNNFTTSDRKTYDVDSLTGKHDLVDAPLTNYFENGYISNRAGLNFRVQQTKYNFQLGMGVQNSELSSHSVRALNSKDTTESQHFTNLYPTANFNYSFSHTKNLRFYYRGRTNQPSISQLQDVPDVSNPLQIRTGNPALKQEFQNTMNLMYNSFNVTTYHYFSANISFTQTGNKIVNSIDSVRKGVTITRPVNMNGSYSASGYLTLGIPFKDPKFKGSSFNASTYGSYGRDVSLLYSQDNFTNNLSVTQNLGMNYSFKEKVDFSLRGSLSYSQVAYSLQPNLNTQYWTQTYAADMNYTFPNNWVVQTDFDYLIYSGRAQGFNQSVPLWNAAVSKLVFKNKAGEIRLGVRDILNQNKSITTNTGDNYYESVRSNVLQRYVMLSFTYTLNRMAGKNMLQNIPGMFRRQNGGGRWRNGGF